MMVLVFNVSNHSAISSGSRPRTALRTRRSIAASPRVSWSLGRRCGQSAHPRGAGRARRGRHASPPHPTDEAAIDVGREREACAARELEGYPEAAMTFGSRRALTLAEVEAALLGALVDRPLE